ncbi:MAG: Chemotaxis response regulator protein-glutamate methylesterase [bacterium]|nr:Chemotaxis response regulator protein-glutamate methylesterase [bacterium]
MVDAETKDKSIRIAVVDDDAHVRQGLWWLLNNVMGLSCAGTYASWGELLAANAPPPDVLLLDVNLPEASGLSGIPPLRAKFPGLKIIMHSNFDDEDKILAAQAAGANGYVLKNASAPQLYQSVMQIYRGEAVWPPGFEPNGNSAAGHGHGSLFKALARRFRRH